MCVCLCLCVWFVVLCCCECVVWFVMVVLCCDACLAFACLDSDLPFSGVVVLLMYCVVDLM